MWLVLRLLVIIGESRINFMHFLKVFFLARLSTDGIAKRVNESYGKESSDIIIQFSVSDGSVFIGTVDKVHEQTKSIIRFGAFKALLKVSRIQVLLLLETEFELIKLGMLLSNHDSINNTDHDRD